MESPSIVALMIGYDLSASAAARAKKGRNDSLLPVFSWKSFLTWSRKAATLVTSTSTTEVSWAEACMEATARSAMILRSRDIGTVVPRSSETSATAAGAAAAGAASVAWLAGARSSLRMRPPTPVPVTVLRSMPRSLASLRTSGVTYPAFATVAASVGASASADGAGASFDGTADGTDDGRYS